MEVIPKVDLPLEAEVEDLHKDLLEEDLMEIDQLETILLVDSQLEARAPQLQSNHLETLEETLVETLKLQLVERLEAILQLQLVERLEETLHLQLVERLEATLQLQLVERLIHHQRALLKRPTRMKISLAILSQLTLHSSNFMEFKRKLVITRRTAISGTSVLISRTPNLLLRKMERI